jgi:hypothetical protein
VPSHTGHQASQVRFSPLGTCNGPAVTQLRGLLQGGRETVQPGSLIPLRPTVSRPGGQAFGVSTGLHLVPQVPKDHVLTSGEVVGSGAESCPQKPY